jgi:hypothetical protein
LSRVLTIRIHSFEGKLGLRNQTRPHKMPRGKLSYHRQNVLGGGERKRREKEVVMKGKNARRWCYTVVLVLGFIGFMFLVSNL